MRACKCPNCGANFEVEEGREFAFCGYCGTKIMLDDVRITHRIIDEARLKEAEIEQIKMVHRLEMEKESKVKGNILFKFAFGLDIALVVAFAISCIISAALRIEAAGILAMLLVYAIVPVSIWVWKIWKSSNDDRKIALGGIKFPEAVNVINHPQSVDSVKTVLQSAGFKNITCNNLHDRNAANALFVKEGRVTSITAGGKEVKPGSVYDADIPIVITHHGK